MINLNLFSFHIFLCLVLVTFFRLLKNSLIFLGFSVIQKINFKELPGVKSDI